MTVPPDPAAADGTAALNAVSHLDMALRGRPAFEQHSGGRRGEDHHTGGTPGPRRGGTGQPALRADRALAMTPADAPTAGLDISDPRTWSPADRTSDAIPHLAYGLVTHGVIAAA
ncbi:hypothetical protein ACFV2N_36990 [Streptomyces sp. NPDC059680]|uniref:hypothetical protein n=1 Tax=Streptomyces sp. NPDC059680 TaxID=3346904 RepID=UPI003695EFA0